MISIQKVFKIIFQTVLLCLVLDGFSSNYAFSLIPDELLQNADIVIREHSCRIVIEKVDKMKSHEKLVRTIIRNDNSNQVNLVFFYDPYRKIKSLKGQILDEAGNVIKELKKKDFTDRSATSSGQLYSDDRLLHYGYNSPTFPITVAYEIVYESKSTGFIEDWDPLNTFNTSVQSSNYEIIIDNSLGLKSKEYNFELYPNISFDQESTIHTYSAQNLPAVKKEYQAPLWRNIAPRASLAIEIFSLQGVSGKNKDWNTIGKWMYHSLIKNQGVLESSVIQQVRHLTSGLSSDKEKAEAIYRFMQDRTRYIGVQLGIGGWKPIAAQKVHDAGYGDCKGLTNYMMSLLKSAGIESHYSVIYGDQTIKNIDSEYSEIEGNHVILCIPDLTPGDTTWLECTSQINPFGYLGSFTGNRNALVLTSEGGFIKPTTFYDKIDNLIENENTITIDETGLASINHKSVLSGVHYDQHRVIEYYKDDFTDFYSKKWGKIQNLAIDEASYSTDKKNVQLVERVQAQAPHFASINKNEILIEAHKIAESIAIPPRSRKRMLPVVIERGSTQKDITLINIPNNYRIESLPNEVKFESTFGTYSLSISKQDNGQLIIKRELIIEAGILPASAYKDYRNFFKKCNKADRTKILITNKS